MVGTGSETTYLLITPDLDQRSWQHRFTRRRQAITLVVVHPVHWFYLMMSRLYSSMTAFIRSDLRKIPNAEKVCGIR